MSGRVYPHERLLKKMRKDRWSYSTRFVYDAVIPDKTTDSSGAVAEKAQPTNPTHYESDWS